MVGFYNYTVILTYMSLVSSITGMFFTFTGHLSIGILCLALSGLFDAFDGKVARSKKDRTMDEKRFGIQIDSLCDLVSFGVFPVVLCWYSGMNTPFGMVILALYCLAGMIRLAYYNVLEEKKNNDDDDAEVIDHRNIGGASYNIRYVTFAWVLFPNSASWNHDTCNDTFHNRFQIP